jgi:hypothetical protein
VPQLQLAVAQQLLQQPPYSMRWLASNSSRCKQVRPSTSDWLQLLQHLAELWCVTQRSIGPGCYHLSLV